MLCSVACPPRLPDDVIRTVLGELRERHAGRSVTGVELREELNRRFGLRGGVARIYRLLRTTQSPSPGSAAASPSPPQAPSTGADLGTEQLREQLRVALERAERAEHRE